MTAPPAFGRDFPVNEFGRNESSPGLQADPSGRPPARTQLFGASPPSPPGPLVARSTGVKPGNAHSVSIVMPAPDGSVMASLSRGPANYVIVRRDKRHGPYDLGQLERLIPMGKLRSVDAIELQDSEQQILAVDLPGLRPLFEARARTEAQSVVRPMPTAPPPAPAASGGRTGLWAVIGVLAFGLIAAAVILAMR